MKKALLILCATLLLNGCSPYTSSEVTEEIQDRVHYVKDHRTGLCFARSRNAYGPVYSMVPCEKVEHLLYNK